ncbi:MAG: SpoVT/AbrB-like protein [Nitrosopumilales archaeon]|nr:MAG: SpoVT/AbrB-like protein [Nitrosopumilales archaeon]
MTGISNQYDPKEMFRDWIQKSGKAQKEFMNTFTSLMTNQPTGKFDPLLTLKGMTGEASKIQSNFMDNINSMQNQAMSNMFSFGQGMSNFLSYSAFKTTVGSNGRISIPEAERKAIKLNEGDLVQVFVLPITTKQKKK